jgi:hypothetical protein
MNAKIHQLLQYLIDRLREPSTYAGIAAVAAMAHHNLSSDVLQGLSFIGGISAGVAAVLLAG